MKNFFVWFKTALGLLHVEARFRRNIDAGEGTPTEDALVSPSRRGVSDSDNEDFALDFTDVAVEDIVGGIIPSVKLPSPLPLPL